MSSAHRFGVCKVPVCEVPQPPECHTPVQDDPSLTGMGFGLCAVCGGGARAGQAGGGALGPAHLSGGVTDRVPI